MRLTLRTEDVDASKASREVRRPLTDKEPNINIPMQDTRPSDGQLLLSQLRMLMEALLLMLLENGLRVVRGFNGTSSGMRT